MSASYPGAVKTFSARSNGNTIDASHINDLQDEVNAIEAGLLNGTAPLTSSNTVVAGLQVNGTSTFVGGVNFSSGGVTSTVTFSKVVTFSSGVAISGAAGLLVQSAAGFQQSIRMGVASLTLSTGESTALAMPSTGIFVLISSTGASTAAISTISGISHSGGNTIGDIHFLNNAGSPTINLQHGGSSATSSNQIICPNGVAISLQTHESVGLFYDGTNWRVFAKAEG